MWFFKLSDVPACKRQPERIEAKGEKKDLLPSIKTDCKSASRFADIRMRNEVTYLDASPSSLIDERSQISNAKSNRSRIIRSKIENSLKFEVPRAILGYMRN